MPIQKNIIDQVFPETLKILSNLIKFQTAIPSLVVIQNAKKAIYQKRNIKDNETEEKGRILIPGEIEINIVYNNQVIHCKHECIVDHNQNIQKLILVNECCGGPKGQILFCKINHTDTISCLSSEYVQSLCK